MLFWKGRSKVARWSIVSTMHGVPETVLPCIAYHLKSDAERIHIYLDTPLPEIEAALASNPRCVVTVCDDAYWAARPAGRPNNLVPRQNANVAHARSASDSDWLVHIDSDEFLVAADPATPLALGTELARVPKEHDWVRILPMERVLPPAPEPKTIFDGVFRSRTDDTALIAAAYGEGAPFLFRGLSGHVRGKIAFRRETRFRVRIHDVIYPVPPGEKPPVVVKPSELPPFT
uniref:glycosyltransferase family 2 protein n=1 Tax=Phaeovulum sp. TaxID=2934796 RepID=UPI0035691549